MFKRSLLKELEEWSVKPMRKPLVLRGASQVRKTTIVNHFAQQFQQYIYLNLELPEDRGPFEQLIQALFFLKNQ